MQKIFDCLCCLRLTLLHEELRCCDVVWWQRYTVTEQGYTDLNNKYMEVVNARQNMERELVALQAALDQERNNRNHESEHTMELNGKQGG